MNKISLLILMLLFNSGLLISQVAINPNGSPPDGSAGLDVNYSNKGFLPPRMTNAELYNISQPANGLIVYCTDCGINGTGAMAVFMAGVWRSIFVNDCLNPLPAPSQGAHVPSPVQIVWNWNPVSNATGYRWNITADFATATDMGTSTTKTETGLNCLIAYTRYVWVYNACGNSLPCSLTESSTGGPLTYPGSAHTGCQCVTDGGTVEAVYEGSSSYTLCKFSGTNLSPPSGWIQAGYWQQYDANTGGDGCGRFVGTLPVIWCNTFGTAYGNSDINGLEPDCSTLPIFWYVWDQGGYYWVYIVASEDNPSSFNIGSSGSVSRIKIGCK